jgi:hypothetical protein
MSKTLDEILKSMNVVASPDRPIRVTTAGRGRKFGGRKSGRRRIFNSWTWSSEEIASHKMSNEKIFIGASDYSDYLYSQLLDARTVDGKSTLSRELKLLGGRSKWQEFIEDEFDGDHILEFHDSAGIIVTEGNNFIRYNVSSNTITVTIYGDEIFLKNASDILLKQFEEVTSYIEWVYSSDGNAVNVPLNVERLPVDEMYPFLKDEKLTDYYDRFLESNANILLLIGPPGTGKTTFIRGLLAHSNSSAIVTYDAQILEKDYLFARFIEDETGVMVLEDSDNFLKARSDGNTMMHRFLNVGDGLVTTKGKKLIFSTNLPSIRDVDPALIRPGRCFDVLSFDQLNAEQAEKLANRLGVSYETKPDGKYSIAEVFNKKVEGTANNKGVGKKMGFV